MEKKLRTAPFGYMKEDVVGYIDYLNSHMGAVVKKKEAEIESLTAKIRELEEKVRSLSSVKNDLDSEKQSIAATLIKANQQAEKIIEEATHEARTKCRELDVALIGQQEALEKAKNDIATLRKSAINVIQTYEQQLSDLLGTATK